MTSIFDSERFTQALFFPRTDVTTPPPGAVDAMVGHVHVRRHAAPNARCSLLLFHGNGEVVCDYDRAAARFASIGAALIVADYRGYGASTGEPTLRALIDDARPIADSCPGPLVVMGRSLGGAAAHELYARPAAHVVGVVLESAYSDVAGLIRRRGLVPPALTADERATFDPLAKLPLGRLPLLILHGAEDDLIVPSEAEATLAAAGSADKTLQLVPGRGHNDLAGGAEYWRALAEFVARV